MKIINAHVHMVELNGMIEKMGDVSLAGGISVLNELESTLPLLNIETLLKQMDDAGIEKSILYAVDAPIVYSSNEYVYKLCQKYPDRLQGVASVDPFAENALEIIEDAVNNLGLKGLKFHPPLQKFYMNDTKVYPIYQKAVELDIPVIFHVGTTPFGSLCRLCHANPLLVDDVAVDFPDLRIMLTHLGTLWHNETFMVVEKNPNVFVDTAAYLYEIENLLNINLINRVGPDKFIFGTDYPMPYANKVHEMKDFVDCIKRINLPDDIKEMIFYKNFEIFYTGSKNDDSIQASDLLKKNKIKQKAGKIR